MPKEGFAVICITKEVFLRAKAFYAKKLQNGEVSDKVSFSRFMNNLLERAVERDEYLSRMPIKIQKIGIFGNSVLLRDHLDRIYQVKISFLDENVELLCLKDKRNDCLHVGYIYSLPEFYQVIRKENQKSVKTIQVS